MKQRNYLKEIEADPNNIDLLLDYAWVLKNRFDYDEAEKYFCLALEIDPNNAKAVCSYAVFLDLYRKNYDKAAEYYKKAIELDPYSTTFSNYANFLTNQMQNYDEAEKYYKLALENEPNEGAYFNYAGFLQKICEDYPNADKYYRLAMELRPNYEPFTMAYDYFLTLYKPNKKMTKKELYTELTAAPDLHKALVDSFSFLADSDGFAPVLEAIMKQVESVEMQDDGYDRDAIYLRFPGDDEPELIYGEVEDEDYSAYPQSYQKIVDSCMYIIFPDDGGWALQFGNDSFNTEETKDKILSPLSDFSDWWIYHPTAKNPQGEPLLCLVSHGTRKTVKAVSCNIGSLLLKRMAESMNIKNIVPDVEAECPESTFTLIVD